MEGAAASSSGKRPLGSEDEDDEVTIVPPGDRIKKRFMSALRKALFIYLSESQARKGPLSLWEQQAVRQVAEADGKLLLEHLDEAPLLIKFAQAQEAYNKLQRLLHLDKMQFIEYASLPQVQLTEILQPFEEHEQLLQLWPLAVAYFNMLIRPPPAADPANSGIIKAAEGAQVSELNPKLSRRRYHGTGRNKKEN